MRHLHKQAQHKVRIAVSLAGVFDGEDSGPKWVMVTREGNFPGYLGGLKPFVFTRADLDQMVANVKAHPSFAVGGDGVATGNVIPWDFNHASEANPASGDLPVIGAPAQGWTLDMEVRLSEDGKAELWALTQFIEPALGYVKTGGYQWASVSVAFNAVDVQTAQNIGALVTSIALTNTPVVEGMEKLVASKNGIPGGQPVSGQVELRRNFFDAARDPAEAINMMRDMFGLPETAGAAEVMGQVAIVQGWIESGTAPLGTNPEELIGNMRIILNLPALTPQIGVLAEATSSIQALLEEQATAVGVPATGPPDGTGMVPEPVEEMIDAAHRRRNKDIMENLIKILAASLGVSESEGAVTRAVTELSELRDSLTLALGLSRDGSKIILAAAKEGVDAKAKLLGLLGALGVEDADAALAKVLANIESAGKLLEVMPELEGLQADAKKVDETAVATDVDSAIAAGQAPAAMRGALLLQRRTEPKEFAEAFPKVTAATQNKDHLLRSVATKGGTPLRIAASQDGSRVDLASADQLGGVETINLANYPGRNLTARAKAYLAGTHTGWDKLTNEQQFLRAVALKAQPNVIDQATA